MNNTAYYYNSTFKVLLPQVTFIKPRSYVKSIYQCYLKTKTTISTLNCIKNNMLTHTFFNTIILIINKLTHAISLNWYNTGICVTLIGYGSLQLQTGMLDRFDFARSRLDVSLCSCCCHTVLVSVIHFITVGILELSQHHKPIHFWCVRLLHTLFQQLNYLTSNNKQIDLQLEISLNNFDVTNITALVLTDLFYHQCRTDIS